jgi:hypothetical protein
MDRTAELYAHLDESPDGTTDMTLDKHEFVQSLTRGKVYGPATLRVRCFLDVPRESIKMTVEFEGHRPSPPKVY